MSVGELAARTGVAATALRYYEDLGLVRPAGRVSGRRRYAPSAVHEVLLLVLLREVGFSLGEIAALLDGDEASWRQGLDRKLEELADRRRRLDVAHDVLEHARRCPEGAPVRCRRLHAVLDGRLQGLALDASHARAH